MPLQGLGVVARPRPIARQFTQTAIRSRLVPSELFGHTNGTIDNRIVGLRDGVVWFRTWIQMFAASSDICPSRPIDAIGTAVSGCPFLLSGGIETASIQPCATVAGET